MYKLRFLLLWICVSFSIFQTSCQIPSTIDYIKSTYQFKPVLYKPMPASMEKELFIPFYDKGKYYMADYNGNQVSDSTWDYVYLPYSGPFFWGAIDGLFNLYRYPDILVLKSEVRVTHPEHLPSVFEIGTANAKKFYSIRLDTLLVPPEGPFASARDSTVTARKSKEEIYFYIPHSADKPVDSWYFSPDHPQSRCRGRIARWGFDYSVVMTKEYNYNIIGADGERIFKEDIFEIVKNGKFYIIGRNEAGKYAIGNVLRKSMTGYIFNLIEPVISCDSTFMASKESESYFVDLDGREITPETDAHGCSTKAEYNASQQSQNDFSIFYENATGMAGVKDSAGIVLLTPEYKIITIAQELGWILVRKDSLYGIFSVKGNWLFPLGPRGLVLSSYDTTASITIHEKGQKLILNQNMELVHEDLVIFQSPEYYEWSAVPDSMRSETKRISTVVIYRPFNIYNDGKYGHIFTSLGQYLSSHPGIGITDRATECIYYNKEKYGKQYVPIGEFKYGPDIKPYYVRLTDGFEYKSK